MALFQYISTFRYLTSAEEYPDDEYLDISKSSSLEDNRKYTVTNRHSLISDKLLQTNEISPSAAVLRTKIYWGISNISAILNVDFPHLFFNMRYNDSSNIRHIFIITKETLFSHSWARERKNAKMTFQQNYFIRKKQKCQSGAFCWLLR